MKKIALIVGVMLGATVAYADSHVEGNVLSLTKAYVMNHIEVGYNEEAYPGRVLRDRIWGVKAPLAQFHRRAYMDTSFLFADGLRKASLEFPLVWSADVVVTPSVSYLEPLDSFGFGFTARIKLR